MMAGQRVHDEPWGWGYVHLSVTDKMFTLFILWDYYIITLFIPFTPTPTTLPLVLLLLLVVVMAVRVTSACSDCIVSLYAYVSRPDYPVWGNQLVCLSVGRLFPQLSAFIGFLQFFVFALRCHELPAFYVSMLIAVISVQIIFRWPD